MVPLHTLRAHYQGDIDNMHTYTSAFWESLEKRLRDTPDRIYAATLIVNEARLEGPGMGNEKREQDEEEIKKVSSRNEVARRERGSLASSAN